MPDTASVDLSLVKLATGAFMFPSPGALPSPDIRVPSQRSLSTALEPSGFPGCGFTISGGTHETLLLDQGVPVHVVGSVCYCIHLQGRVVLGRGYEQFHASAAIAK